MKRTTPKTSLFPQCVGVFEGGGVRGAAFAGAIAACRELGIDLVAAIGTSAGAIAAALVAANATDDDVRSVLKTPLFGLLRPPDSPLTPWQHGLIGMSSVLGAWARRPVELQFRMGLYSSTPIERWSQEQLARILGRSPGGSVLFSHLPRPLAILATDIASRGFAVFSRDTTATTPVAHAIRCSCAIPFFFEPVRTLGGGSFFVDGGVLANLPVFLVPYLGPDYRDTPVLCFRLIADQPAPQIVPKTGTGLAKAIIETVLNGSTQIQLSQATSRQVIDIPTGETSSTDFRIDSSKIDGLYESGYRAVVAFVEDEQERVVASQRPSQLLGNLREGLLTETADVIGSARSRIDLLAGDLSWLRDVYVFLLRMRLRRGVAIRILCGNSVSATTLAAARSLGAEIRFLEKMPPVKATIIDGGEAALTIEGTGQGLFGRRLQAPRDADLAALLGEYFASSLRLMPPIAEPSGPEILPITPDQLCRALKRVRQYEESSIEMKDVPIADLHPLSLYLERFKLRRAAEARTLLQEGGFHSAAQPRGSPWPITPPVVEELRNGKLVIVDGTHRVKIEMDAGTPMLRALVVRDHKAPLPADIVTWAETRLVPQKRPREQRYRNLRPEHFREIRAAFEQADLGGDTNP